MRVYLLNPGFLKVNLLNTGGFKGLPTKSRVFKGKPTKYKGVLRVYLLNKGVLRDIAPLFCGNDRAQGSHIQIRNQPERKMGNTKNLNKIYLLHTINS